MFGFQKIAGTILDMVYLFGGMNQGVELRGSLLKHLGEKNWWRGAGLGGIMG